MKRISHFFVLLLLCLFILSCSKNNTTETPYLGYSYFPSNVGHYIIYEVDSTKKDGFTGVVTHNRYLIKEVVESIFTDNQGRPTLRIERYRKDSLFYPDWTIYNVWTANLTATTAERFENNIRYVKLTFPVENGKSWNGNSMNTLTEEDYEYTGIHEPGTINGLTFDSITTVLQINDTFNFVEPKYKLEQYAAGVGLIYRKKLAMLTQIDTLTGQPDTLSFIDYVETVIGYGN